MGRQDPALAGEKIIKGKTQLDGQDSPGAWTSLHTEKTHRCIEQSGKDRVYGNGGGQGEHHVRCIPEESVTFEKTFAHKVEFAILEIAQSTMYHPRRGSRAARTEVFALYQQNAKPLQGQIAKCANAIDAAAHHDHVEGPIPANLGDVLSTRVHHGTFIGNLIAGSQSGRCSVQASRLMKCLDMAASMIASSLGDRRIRPAAAFSRACSGLRAPQSADVMPG